MKSLHCAIPAVEEQRLSPPPSAVVSLVDCCSEQGDGVGQGKRGPSVWGRLLRQLRCTALDPSPRSFAFTDWDVTDLVFIMHQQTGCNTYNVGWKYNKILADAAVRFY